MNANPPRLHTRSPGLALAALLAALGGCVPAPPRAPATVARRAPPAPLPPPSAPPPADWRDAPATPGDWSWSREGTASVARFAGGLFTVRCDNRGGAVLLARAGTAPSPVPMTVTTTTISRPLTAAPIGGPTPAIGALLASRDPLLDAMVFSRGRFAVEAMGMAPLYLPAWPELARVIEDCR